MDRKFLFLVLGFVMFLLSVGVALAQSQNISVNDSASNTAINDFSVLTGDGWQRNTSTGVVVFNETMDMSGNGNDLTVNGATWDGDNTYGFDGTNDYLTTGDNLGITNYPFTLSTWVYMNEEQQGGLVSLNADDDTYYIIERSSDAGKFRMQVRDGANYFHAINTFGSYNTNEWYQLTWVFKNSTNFYMYVNGELDRGFSVASSAFSSSVDNFYIGKLRDSGIFLNGSLGDVRVYNTALSEGEVGDLYSFGNVTSGLVAWYPFQRLDDTNRSLNDTSFNSNTLTNSGATISGGAASFDGTNDYIDIDTDIILQDGNSLSFWFKTNELVNSGIFANLPDTFGSSINIIFPTGCITAEDTAGTFKGVGSNCNINDGWNNFILIYDSGFLNVYYNNVFKGSSSYTGNFTLGVIGSGYAGYTNPYFNGSLDDLMIFDRVLSSDEILALFENRSVLGAVASYDFDEYRNVSVTAIPSNTSTIRYDSVSGFWSTASSITLLADRLEQRFTFSARNIYDNISISNFTVELNGVANTTTSGFASLWANYNASNSLSFYNAVDGDGAYFNQSDNMYTGLDNYTADMVQATINLTGIDVLGITRTADNWYANATRLLTSTVQHIRVGNHNITFTKTGWYNTTQEINVPALSYQNYNITGLYNQILEATAKNSYDNLTINNFTTRLTYNATDFTSTTTNGTATFNLVDLYNYTALYYNAVDGDGVYFNKTYADLNITDPSPSFGSEPYVLIQASSVNKTGLEINGVIVTQFYDDLWKLNNTGVGDEVKRAKIMQTLFYGTDGSDPRLTASYVTGLVNIYSNDVRDIGKTPYYLEAGATSSTASSRSIYILGELNDTSNNFNVSSWSNLNRASGTTNVIRWQVPSGVTLNEADSSPTTSNEIGTDTSSDQIDNPASFRLNLGFGDSGTMTGKAIVFVSGGVNITNNSPQADVTTNSLVVTEFITFKSISDYDPVYGLVGYLDQAFLSLDAYSKISNTSVQGSFLNNDTGLAWVQGEPIRAGTYNFTYYNNSNDWYNKSQIITIPALFNGTKNITGLYDNVLNIGFLHAQDNTSINPMNGYIYNTTYSFNESFTGTPNASVQLEQGLNYTVVPTTTNYTSGLSYSKNTTPNAITTSETLYLYKYNSITINIYNGTTTDLLDQPVTIYIISDTDNTATTTSTGQAYLALLEPELYELRFVSQDYNTISKFIFVTNNSANSIDVYMTENNTAELQTFQVLDTSNTEVQGAILWVQKQVPNSTNQWVTVAEIETNNEGYAYAYIIKDSQVFYRFAVKYDEEFKPIQPTGNTYTSKTSFISGVNTINQIVINLAETTTDYITDRLNLGCSISYTGANNTTAVFDFADSNNAITGGKIVIKGKYLTNLTDFQQLYTAQLNSSTGSLNYTFTVLNNTIYETQGIIVFSDHTEICSLNTKRFDADVLVDKNTGLLYAVFIIAIVALLTVKYGPLISSAFSFLSLFPLTIFGIIDLPISIITSLIVLAMIIFGKAKNEQTGGGA